MANWFDSRDYTTITTSSGVFCRVVVYEYGIAPEKWIQTGNKGPWKNASNLFSTFWIRVLGKSERVVSTGGTPRGLTVTESIQAICALSSVRPTSNITSKFRVQYTVPDLIRSVSYGAVERSACILHRTSNLSV